MKRKWSVRKVVMLLLAAALLCVAAWYVYTIVALRQVNAALAGLKSSDPAVYAAAVEKLSRCTSTIAIERMIKTYGDEEADDAAITRALVKIGRPAVKPLIGALMQRGSWTKVSNYVITLRRVHNVKQFSALFKRRQRIQRFAIRPLGLIGAPAADALLPELENRDAGARQLAALVLGRTGDRRAFEPLVAALAEISWRSRHSAADGLGRLGDLRAVEPLIAALKDTNHFVRDGAARSLGELRDRRATEPLIAALGDTEWLVRLSAAEALGRIGDPRAVEPLIAAIGDPDGAVGMRAVEALGAIGDPRAVGPLAAVVSGGLYPDCRAVISLEYIGGEEAKAAIETQFSQEDVRDAAADYKARILDGAARDRWLLMLALERFGTLAMAQDFRWSGFRDLENAARHWAEKRGLTKELEEFTNSPDRPRWGKNAKPPQ